MKVRDIMTPEPESCTPATDLAAAAMIMWRNDCGAVPVVSADGRKAMGMITDRDICMAVATRHSRPEEIKVGQVISGRLASVSPKDDVQAVLNLMRLEQVRRVPVVREYGTLLGIVSMNDVVVHSGTGKGHRHTALSPDEIARTLRGICEHRGGSLVPAGKKPATADQRAMEVAAGT